MPYGVLIANVARRPLIDRAALAQGVEHGRTAGAGQVSPVRCDCG